MTRFDAPRTLQDAHALARAERAAAVQIIARSWFGLRGLFAAKVQAC